MDEEKIELMGLEIDEQVDIKQDLELMVEKKEFKSTHVTIAELLKELTKIQKYKWLDRNSIQFKDVGTLFLNDINVVAEGVEMIKICEQKLT